MLGPKCDSPRAALGVIHCDGEDDRHDQADDERPLDDVTLFAAVTAAALAGQQVIPLLFFGALAR